MDTAESVSSQSILYSSPKSFDIFSIIWLTKESASCSVPSKTEAFCHRKNSSFKTSRKGICVSNESHKGSFLQILLSTTRLPFVVTTITGFKCERYIHRFPLLCRFTTGGSIFFLFLRFKESFLNRQMLLDGKNVTDFFMSQLAANTLAADNGIRNKARAMYFNFSSILSHNNYYLNEAQKQHGTKLHTDEPLFYNTSICPSRIITYQKNTFYKNNSLFFSRKIRKKKPGSLRGRVF